MCKCLTLFVLMCLPLWAQSQLLDSLLLSDTSAIVKKVMADPDKYRLQICYTQVRQPFLQARGLLNLPSILDMREKVTFTHHSYRSKPDEYFFPASLVKLPTAAYALEYLQQLRIYGIDHSTPFAPLNDFQCKWSKNKNPKVPPQSAYELIHKIFVYSDNAAYNYLYELCGQAYLQRRMDEMGFPKARIVEKIANCNSGNNRTTGPVAFYSHKELFHMEGRQTSPEPPAHDVAARVGKGHIWNGKYIPAPKDFSTSNFIPLDNLHQMMLRLYFPKKFSKTEQFRLSESDLGLLSKAMATLPSQYCPDSCEGNNFADNHMKYLFGWNDTIPRHIKIFNKVGLAHGFMSDCAYLMDMENDVHLVVSAVVYVNSDGILNDGKYEYQTIGLPFLRRLGFLLYQSQLTDKRNH